MESVKQNGMALEIVPEALKPEAFCAEAVKQDVEAKEFVPEALKAAVETATEETPDAGEDDCGPRP